MIDTVIQGVLLGGYYAILAAGLSLMFGVVRFINLAHGDLAVLGAYLVVFITTRWDVSPWIVMIGILPVMGAIGWLLQSCLFDRSIKGGPLMPLLTTFGLGAVVQNLIFGLFGSDTCSLGNRIGSLSWSSWQLPFDISIGKLPVITFAVALVLLFLLQAVLSFTRLGRAIRATSGDPEAARLTGIDAGTVHRYTSAMALALAGIAGVFLSMRALITPYSGPVQLIFAFEAVVIGGVGSVWGTLMGGIVLGISQSIGAGYSPQWFQLSGHLVFSGILGVRLYLAHWRNLGRGNPIHILIQAFKKKISQPSLESRS